MTRRDHGDWGIAVALLVAVVATIAFRIIELRAGDSAEQARVDARHAIALATKVEDAAQRLDTCVTESRCDDPAEFSPGRRTFNEGLVVALTRGVAPAYVPFTEMTHEWNHAVIAAIDEDGVVTDQPAAETLAGGPMIDDLLSELDRVHGELTDDAAASQLLSDIAGWVWKVSLLLAVVSPFGLILLRRRCDRRQDREPRAAMASARGTPGTTSTPAGPSSTNVS